MTLPGELCTEVQEEHRGRTHEGSRLDFLMQSVLVPEKGVCSIWALRTAEDGKPFFPLAQVAGNTLSSCEAFGFIADGTVSACRYGDNAGYSDCGFPSAKFYGYGNRCSGCTQNDGTYKKYVLQGVIHSGSVIGDFSGSVRASCKIIP